MKSENVGGGFDGGDALQSADQSAESVPRGDMGIPHFMLEICDILLDIQRDHGREQERGW